VKSRAASSLATVRDIATITGNSDSSRLKQSSDDLPPRELYLELVDLYFDFIHDQFHTLFHKPTFIEDVQNDRAPLVITFAMMALSARLVCFLGP